MSLFGYIRLTRPLIPIAAGVATAMAYLITGGTNLFLAIGTFLCPFLICLGGRALDDAFDAEYDKLYHPLRPIPQNKATVRGAGVLCAVLFFLGFLVSCFAGFGCMLLCFINILLIIMYSTNFKRFPVLGNLSIAYLAGSLFLYGGLMNGLENFQLSIALAAMAFFEVLAYEVIKDGISVDEDRYTEGHSLSLYFGTKYTVIMAFILVVIAVGISMIPVIYWGATYAILIGIVDILFLLFAILALPARNPQTLRKKRVRHNFLICIFLSIVVFIIIALIEWFQLF